MVQLVGIYNEREVAAADRYGLVARRGLCRFLFFSLPLPPRHPYHTLEASGLPEAPLSHFGGLGAIRVTHITLRRPRSSRRHPYHTLEAFLETVPAPEL